MIQTVTSLLLKNIQESWLNTKQRKKLSNVRSLTFLDSTPDLNPTPFMYYTYNDVVVPINE
jgi:hypothetical protein